MTTGLFLLGALLACSNPPHLQKPPVSRQASFPTLPLLTPTNLPRPTLLPTFHPPAATPSHTPNSTNISQYYRLNPYIGELRLVRNPNPNTSECEQPSPFYLPSQNLQAVAHVKTGVCFNGEIGLFEMGGRRYVVLSGGTEAAYSLIDVSDASTPRLLGVWSFRPWTYTADVKPFRIGERWYLALAMESVSDIQPCGVAIVDVSEAQMPVLVANLQGYAIGSETAWCNVHTTEIVTNAAGEATHLLVSSDDTFDLRVVDLSNLPSTQETGKFAHQDFRIHNGNVETFVHDSTVVGERVYVAYWSGGVQVLDTAALVSGADSASVTLNPFGSLAPANFQVHHAYPSADGQFLFIEDEVNDAKGFSQLRWYDIRNLQAPKFIGEIYPQAGANPLSPPHNLLVQADLLFVGWYKDGVQVFRYDTSQPNAPSIERYAYQAVREDADSMGIGYELFDGIYGVRVQNCVLAGVVRQCVYASDLTLGLLILALE